MTRLQDLYEIGGQSPWLDNLRRDWLHDNQLAELVALGVRGITSNPTIFAKAMTGQSTYDDQFRALMKDHTVESAYWEMATTDIQDALALLRPLYDESDGEDGFVSLEVSPSLAHDTEGTVRDARRFHDTIAQPNLLVKVPATREGVPAIETLIGEGRSINVTLIFGLDRYDEVMEAYLRGLEALVAAGRQADVITGDRIAVGMVPAARTEVDSRPRVPRDHVPASDGASADHIRTGADHVDPRMPEVGDGLGPGQVRADVIAHDDVVGAAHLGHIARIVIPRAG